MDDLFMNLIFMGAPGAGKGTQAAILCDRFNIPKISTGDILREAVENKIDFREKVNSFIDKGKLVPDDIVVDIIRERIIQEDCKAGFLLDGFPRNHIQAEALDKILAENDIEIDKVVYFDVDHANLMKRLLKRSELEGRSDDNEASIENRLNVFHTSTKPLLNYYDTKRKLICVLGQGTVEEVSFRVQEALNLHVH